MAVVEHIMFVYKPALTSAKMEGIWPELAHLAFVSCSPGSRLRREWALCLCAASVLSKQKSTECILLSVQEAGRAGVAS